MSLTGSLEDIALGELLQIVGLSRKNGFIKVVSRGREGRIVFCNGLVTEANSSTFRQSYGELLIRKGIINLGQMRQALAVQESEGQTELLGSVLSRLFDIPSDNVEEVGREQVQNVVQSLFEWAEGTFEFHVDEEPDETAGDHLSATLAEGLDPDRLADDAARIVEEIKVDFSSQPERPSGPRPVVPAVPPLVAAVAQASASAGTGIEETRTVLIVDDDDTTRRLLAEAVGRAGFSIRSFAKTEDALTSIDSLCRSGSVPIVVVDLIMPRMDGSGLLGGLELLEFIKEHYPRLEALALCDYRSREAEQKVLDMGYGFLPKPGKNEITAAIGPFCETLLRLLGPSAMAAAVANPVANALNLADELRQELGEPDGMGERPKASAGVSLLRGMLQELHDPDLGRDVILLVLRFASEFMNRAVLFLVREETITGVGQFGIAGKDADSRVRSLAIPVAPPSMFDRALEAKIPLNAVPERTALNEQILDRLGGSWPKEVFLGPILSEGRVVAILYGDNLPEKKGVGDTESLEIFLSQAGSAMERALVPLDGEREETADGVDR